jgi:hypothetical protein
MKATTRTSQLYAVLKRMRELTKAGVPFNIEFISYQETAGITEGLKSASGIQLRTGMSKAYSDKADVLIGYVKDGKNRWFNLPLLIKFNNKFIHEY